MFDHYQRGFMAQRLGHSVRVHFEGWESTLSRLMNSGWNVQSEYDLQRDAGMMVMVNDRLKLVSYTPMVRFMERAEVHDLQVTHVTCAQQTYIQGNHRPNFVAMRLDLNEMITPAMVETRFCLADILQPMDIDKLLVAKEDEKTVDDLLSHILSKQTDLRQEIAERRVRESIIEKPSAQIIKLFAA